MPGDSLTTAGNPTTPPVKITEGHDLTSVLVHYDFDFSSQQLQDINAELLAVGAPPLRRASRRAHWASQSDIGDHWDFYIDAQVLGDEEDAYPTVHFVLNASKPRVGTPIPYRRSSRAHNRARATIKVLAEHAPPQQFDCQVTWHPMPVTPFFTDMLPVDHDFPDHSTINEITGVVGSNPDRSIRFMVDRVETEPSMYHVWVTFSRHLTLDPDILDQAASYGSSLLDEINVWEN